MAEDRSRPDRAEEVRRERRFKPGKTALDGLRLAVDDSKLDRSKFEYRWVNDSPGRMAMMHEKDWDPVTEIEGSDAEGTVQSKVVGAAEGGAPMKGVLMRKYKDWYKDDQARKRVPLDEMDKAIREGTNHQKSEAVLREGSYTPGGRNVIETSSTR